MATIIGYGSKHSHEFKLTVNEISTNIENNTSEVSFSFTIYKSSYSWSGWNTITYTIDINGTTYTGTIPSYSAGSTLTIRTGNQTIVHNDDGKKSINCSFSVNDTTGQSYTCGNASGSDVVKLTTLARKSTINSFFGENIEDYFSVTYTSYYSKFTNKLRISIPNVKELETFEYESGTTFKLSDETIEYLYSYMKKSKTVLIGMVIETWNGSTKIGESVELTKTCYITDCDPQIESYNYLDTNSKTIEITNDNQKIIRHMSNLRINLTNLTSYKGAELSKCTVTINNITKSFSNISGTSIESTYLDFGTLDVSEDINAVITLTDTRGNYTTKEFKISIYNYVLLSINATIKRVQSTTGEVGIEFSGNYFNGSFGSINNELSINWKYKEKGQDEWIDGGNIMPVIKDNTFSNGNTVISLGKIFDYQKAYEFMLVVNDKLSTLEPTFPNSVPKGIPIFNWGEDFVNIYGALKIKEINILELIFPVGSTYITQENINPNEILGFGTWERLKGKVCLGIDEDDTDLNEVGNTGGEKEHILTTSEMPKHSHKVIAQGMTPEGVNGYSIGTTGTVKYDTESTGGGKAHNNMQPYEVVGYMWIRRN